MTTSGHKIELVTNPRGKRGTVMMWEHYSRLSEFILDTIMETKRTRLNDLLERVRYQVSFKSCYDVSWSLLQVKLDLEARGFIAMESTQKTHRLPFIRLTRKGLQAVRHKESKGIESLYSLLSNDHF